jgi:hypothetical protein
MPARLRTRKAQLASPVRSFVPAYFGRGNSYHDHERQEISRCFVHYLKSSAALKDIRDRSKLSQYTPIVSAGLATRAINGRVTVHGPNVTASIRPSSTRAICHTAEPLANLTI